HGVFVPNLPAPRGRTVMIPRLDESLMVDDHEIRLTGPERSDGTIDGMTAELLREFQLDWLMPTWIFEIDGRRLQKRITMPHGQSTVYVEYRLLEGAPVKLRLRPYVNLRGHDDPLGHSEDWPFTVKSSRGRVEVQAYHDAPHLKLAMRPRSGDVFVIDEKRLANVFYRVEKERGLDTTEDLVSPGYFTVVLGPNEPIAFVGSTESWERLEHAPDLIFHAERTRLERVLHQSPESLRQGFAAQLVLAADQFITLPGTRIEEHTLSAAYGEQVRTVVAGYHWFTDWGRDTMISLEGLALCTGRHQEARAILRTFSHYIQNGLLPNHFPEGHRTAIYNTIDATFWFFHAVERYLEFTDDRETLRDLYPALKDIIERHLKGTDFGIGVDPHDGLVRGIAPGFALTWMDAKVEDWVVTPRRGKPVEIQGLWYNALRLMCGWADSLGEGSKEYCDLAECVYESFNRKFWCQKSNYLYDVIETEKGEPDASLRPNQIFAFSLRHAVLKPELWRPVLDVVTEKLLTPVGVRTLDPADPDYHGRYEGNRWARDAAYHQGLVWAWLIGPYLDAWRKVYPEGREGQTARDHLAGFESHLREAGLGTISEIFDGEVPHRPRGCIAQAWSVAEILRVLLSIELAKAKRGRDPAYHGQIASRTEVAHSTPAPAATR
ncbi:MAG: glycogen debranching enzyme family protein, partial [Verrucomicrobiae bacterium]|nr:glycogen debranching enzyme family protein [Verrucomicrobiae bacterium]